jgi:putative peptidoglycan lipid II flippase
MSTPPRARGHASVVAFGIFASRIAGFLRDRALAHYFGVGPHADVFRVALRGPNLLQNLLGEGTISAAFIPGYSRLLAEERPEDAGRFAGAIFGLLVAVVGTICALGVIFAEPLTTVFVPGFLDDAARVAAGEAEVDRFPLAVLAVRILFPMTGVLVLSAWALGILNSHRRFLLPYTAPVLWNVAIIAALVLAANGVVGVPGMEGADAWLIAACVGALAGGALQFLVQLPLVLRVTTGLRPSLSTRAPGVRGALRATGPAIVGRGAYQISGYLDQVLASFLVAGAVGAIGWAQTLYILPISLFGMSVAAAELPELARRAGTAREEIPGRLTRAFSQMLFLTLPTLVGYAAFGYLIVGALFRTGAFEEEGQRLVYAVLLGYTAGLLPTTASRLTQNAFYALDDTRTPARIAIVRVAVSAAVALPAMLALDRVAVPGVSGDLRLGAAGLAIGSGVGAWVELLALRAKLRGRLGEGTSLTRGLGKMLVAAAAGLIVGGAVWWALPALHPFPAAAIVVGAYGATYLAVARLLGLREAERWLRR